MNLKGRTETINIENKDLKSYTFQMRGDMFKKIAGNGVYLSGNSNFFTMSTFICCRTRISVVSTERTIYK